jgi:hypothetical protein
MSLANDIVYTYDYGHRVLPVTGILERKPISTHDHRGTDEDPPGRTLSG